MAKRYSVAEAAKVLNVAPKTIRRRVKAGTLKATREPGPYGEQIWLDAAEVDRLAPTARQVTEIVPVQRTTDLASFAETLEERLKEAVRDAVREELAKDRQRSWWHRTFGRREQ